MFSLKRKISFTDLKQISIRSHLFLLGFLLELHHITHSENQFAKPKIK